MRVSTSSDGTRDIGPSGAGKARAADMPGRGEAGRPGYEVSLYGICIPLYGPWVEDHRVDTYTHGHAEPVLQSHRWRTADNSAGYLLPLLRPGLDLLDVGCGPRTITVDLAARVAP